ncbi:WGR domain-containing protein [Microvirga sp. 2TAF3]|uniref:WGR domain-containing protein n=1 Tax=Microvirga sp. 2TAF3 TaxID=3233014 RepID=UPI003F946598
MPNFVVLNRSDSAKNMARFYILSIEASLFGDLALIREWGRIGTAGQRKVELYENEESAAVSFQKWLLRKQRRGYRIRLTY